MKIYITKYALTKGILEKEGEIGNCGLGDFIVVKSEYMDEIYHKPYFHFTYEDAIKHADEMRLKKIKSLKKQIGNLEKLKF